MLAQRPTPSQRKCPDLGPSLEALHLTAASWKGIQVLWGDKAMPRRPAWLTRASFPTPLRPSDLCCARLPLSGCPPVGVHLQGSGPFGSKSALHLQAVADTLGWICSPVFPHLSGFPCNPKDMVTAPCSDK